MLLGLDEKDPETNSRVRAFRLGMRDLGWVEGRNVQVEYRFAGTKLESINKHVAEVIRLAPDVIVAHSSAVVAALRPATSTVPIVVAMAVDPVGQGCISNLEHPGGNITGFSFIEFEIIGKWINLLSDVKPELRSGSPSGVFAGNAGRWLGGRTQFKHRISVDRRRHFAP